MESCGSQQNGLVQENRNSSSLGVSTQTGQGFGMRASLKSGLEGLPLWPSG